MSDIDLSTVDIEDLVDELNERDGEEYVLLSKVPTWDLLDELFDRGERQSCPADFDTWDLQEELESRGFVVYDNESDPYFSRIVQEIRCGNLKIEGKMANELLDLLYEKANKVV